ncbi:MAG: DsrE family protein [Candidatus Eremiobacteraeota bacterium]|nr:DsrE family protein [Candidatus Eremiobacteraeota bacterium]
MVIVVPGKGLGKTADEQFGVEMLEKFFHTLERFEEKPEAICFYTEGVYNVVDDSPTLFGLKLLEGMGVEIVACQTCLERFGLADRLAVGRPDGMVGILGWLQRADKVVTV